MECEKNGVDGMCHLGVSQLIIVVKKSVFCVRWTSQVQGFEFSKLLMRKRHVLLILF